MQIAFTITDCGRCWHQVYFWMWANSYRGLHGITFSHANKVSPEAELSFPAKAFGGLVQAQAQEILKIIATGVTGEHMQYWLEWWVIWATIFASQNQWVFNKLIIIGFPTIVGSNPPVHWTWSNKIRGRSAPEAWGGVTFASGCGWGAIGPLAESWEASPPTNCFCWGVGVRVGGSVPLFDSTSILGATGSALGGGSTLFSASSSPVGVGSGSSCTSICWWVCGFLAPNKCSIPSWFDFGVFNINWCYGC